MGRLTTIELFNFKSYKGRQRVELGNSSFTSIIGPNGAGKSNMMDAISFVLGIRTKQLRSSHLKELIYRGRVMASDNDNDDDVNGDGFQTKSADPTRAHVMVTYQKDDGSEMKLKRSITSSGGSEYNINGRSVSHMDYVVALEKENIIIKAKNFLVFQGDVEAIASQSPKNLSEMVEKISGSDDLKEDYERLRKEQQEVSELSTSVFNKKRAYNTEIKQYQNQKAEVESFNNKIKQRDNLIISHVLWKLYHLEKKADESKKKIADVLAQLELDTASHSDVKSMLDAAAVEYATANKEYQRIERLHKRGSKQLHESQTSLVPIDQKIKIMSRNLESHTDRMNEAKTTSKKQAQEIERLNRQLVTVSKALDKFEKDSAAEAQRSGLDVSDADFREYESLKTTFNQETAVQQSNLANLMRQRKTSKDSLDGLQSKYDQAIVLKSKLISEVESLKAQFNEISAKINDDNSRLQEIKQQIDVSSAERQRKNKELDILNIKLRDCLTTLNDYNTDRHESERERVLREAVSTLKRIMPGVKGFVLDLCQPKERKFQDAISTAIGRNLHSIVVDTFRTGQECLSYMKEQRVGTASIIPLDTISVKPINGALRGFDRRVRLAIDCVSFDRGVERAIQFVCGDTVICDDIRTAKYVRWEKNLEVKAVTLDGLVIHRSQLMSGGRTENSNSRQWDDAKVSGLKKLKDKLIADVQNLSQNDYEKASMEEQLIGEQSHLEMRLGSNREEVSEVKTKLNSRESEFSHVVKSLSKEIEPSLDNAKSLFDRLSSEYGELESSMDSISNSIFSTFCSKIGVPSIKLFEKAQSNFAEEVSKQKLQFTSQTMRLRNQLKFEKERLTETNHRLDMLEESVEKTQTALNELEKEKNVVVDQVSSIEKDLKQLETSLGNQKATCSKRLVDVDECKDRLALANLNFSKTSRMRDSLQDEISKLENNQLATLRDCKLGGTNIPLLEGSLDNIPLEEVILEESASRNNDTQDADGDVDMVDADATFGSKDKLHGIVVDYESLNETYMNDSDDSVENRFLENIKTLSNDIEKMVINVRAEEKLAEITDKLKEVQDEFNEVKKRAKATKENFDAVKKKRYELFNKAYAHISKQIDSIYKDLTRRKTCPMGGSAFLNLENEEEPYLEGITYHAMPPNKRFCEMELLSGGEKTIAALALLFAIHSYQPSPFFILDEIDAALDNANVFSISNYIKSHCGNGFQFIVISLKNGLFENSESLVGIYRAQDENSSRALTYDLTVQ